MYTSDVEKYKLYNENCYDLIKRIPDSSIDVILTDPPYNISQYSRGNITRTGKTTLNNDIATWDKIPIEPAALVNGFKRIIKPEGNIFIFTSYNLLGKWHEIFDKEFNTFQFFIWHKTNPAPKVYKNGFLNSCEIIICLWNKGHKWNFTEQQNMHNFFECPICSYPERLTDPKHPTQKPVKLLRHLIEISSNVDDVIFDPFMGVGSTGCAAILTNRKFIGTEIDEIYFNAACNRMLKL